MLQYIIFRSEAQFKVSRLKRAMRLGSQAMQWFQRMGWRLGAPVPLLSTRAAEEGRVNGRAKLAK